MKDSTLMKISFCCSLLGILLILFITENATIKSYKISEIRLQDIDKLVSISGEITRITDTPSILLTDINDETGSITVVIFKDANLTLERYQEVVIEGKVTEYEGKIEIQAETIRKKLI